MANKKVTKKTVDAVYEEEKPTKSAKKKAETVEIEEVEEVESPIKEGMSETTKGMIIGIIITSLIASIIILLILGKNDGTQTNYVNRENASAMMNEFYEHWEGDKATLVVFASSQCGYCTLQEPIVERIGDMYNLDYLYMDYLKLEEDEVEAVVEYLGITGSTPTSVIVKDGKVLKTLVGFNDIDAYMEFLIEGGVLEKGSTYKDEDHLTKIDYTKFKKLLNGKETSAIIFDQYMNCGESCLVERATLSSIAKKYNISAYHLPADALTEEQISEFVDKLGSWGYSTDAYKKDKSISIPLLMFVRDGKIIWHQNGNMTEDDILKQVKEYNLVK